MQKLFVILPNNCILANYVKMKTAYTKIIFRCLMASFVILMSQALESCMKDEEVITSPECAITSFSVGSITSQVTIKKYDANGNATDTVVSRTIGGSEIFFNIDHLNGKITSVDALPKWANLEKVVPSFGSTGNVLAKIGTDSLYYMISSGSDSINFTKPVEFICVAYNGASTKKYTVEIRKSESDLTIMEWTKSASRVDLKGMSKIFYTDTNDMFVFSKNAEGKNIVNCTSTVLGTTETKSFEMPKSDLDCNSVLMFNNKFYALDSEGHIYCASPSEADKAWNLASDKTIERLLCIDNLRLYAYDGTAIVGTSDMNTWNEYGKADLDMLPESSINTAIYRTRINSSISDVVMIGHTSKNANNCVAWYKQSSKEVMNDQNWAYIQITPDNAFGLPKLENLSMARSKGALYAIGTINDSYECFYRSNDNGITWHKLDLEKYTLPKELNAENGKAILMGSDDKLWIYQEDGTVWEANTL